MYKINDYVIYKKDVCIIKDIRENKLNGTTYYVMTPLDDESLIIDTPTNNKLGFIRDVMTKDKALELINKIPSIEPILDIDDKKLELKYKELLNTHNYEDIIRIIKTTYLRNENRINNKRKISEKDKIYFNLAEKYLYNELSISLNMTRSEVKDYIASIVKKSNN